MKLLGNHMLSAMDDVTTGETPSPPYELPYTPPKAGSPNPPDYFEPYRYTGITPLHRQMPRPLRPTDELTDPRHLIPPMPGPRYIQGGVGKVVPATHAPDYDRPMVNDLTLIKILVVKNTFLALEKRGLPTMAMRRRMLDENTQRLVEYDVLLQTLSDINAVQRGDFSALNAGSAWQYDAIKNNLVDTADLNNIVARGVGVQVWTEKSSPPY